MTLTRTVTLGVAIAVLVGGCASASGRMESCRSDLAASGLPLSDVVDSTALQGVLEEAWVDGTALALAGLYYDSLGDRSGVQVWAESLSEGARESLKTELERLSLPTHEANEGVNIFLGDHDGPAPRRVARFRSCEPGIQRVTELTSRIAAEAQQLNLRRRVQVYLLALVRPDGTVGEVRVDESSGLINADLAAARVVQSATFRPAVMEGMRVEVWTRFPITFVPRRSGGGK